MGSARKRLTNPCQRVQIGFGTEEHHQQSETDVLSEAGAFVRFAEAAPIDLHTCARMEHERKKATHEANIYRFVWQPQESHCFSSECITYYLF